MTIIISKNGKNAIKVEKSPIEKEDYLQEYILENPDSIPIYDIKEDLRLLILAREFPTESGPIDALAVDNYGNLYVVETKLYKNPDKRKVVAQSLDYGASLWRHTAEFDRFISILDRFSQEKFKLNSREKLQEYFKLDEEQIELLFETLRRNIQEGNIKFVVLMDEIGDRLKDLIVYINQNSKFDIYAVEFEYYKVDEQEIIIPRLFGGEVKKSVSVAGSQTRNKWDEASMLAKAKETLNDQEYIAFKKMYDFSKENASRINFGTGAYPSFSPIFESLSSKSLFSLSTSPNYSLGLNFEWVVKDGREDTAKIFKEKMCELDFKIPDDYLGIRPSIKLEEWVPKADLIIESLEKMLKVR